MRKSFDGLSFLVKNQLRDDPLSGRWYVVLGILGRSPVTMRPTLVARRKGASRAAARSARPIVAGVKGRATGRVSASVVRNVKKGTLHVFVHERVDPGATVYTDELRSYRGVAERHDTVNHTAREYVRDQAHKRHRVILVDAESGSMMGPTTSSATSTCNTTWTSSPVGTTFAAWTPRTRCARWRSGCVASG